METYAQTSWQVWPIYALIAIAMISYTWEKCSLEITSLAVVVALLLLFHFFPLESGETGRALSHAVLLSGFANPALIVVMALLVIGHGVFLTDALAPFLRVLQHAGSGFPTSTLLLLFLLIALTSAFLNNTPVVIIFVPLVGALAERIGIVRSRVMMPVSFLAILGGMTTLIGSSTNILVAESARSVGGYKIGFFDFFIPGLFLTALGMTYLLLFASRLLPNREAKDGGDGKFPELYTTQIRIVSEHPLLGAKISADGIEGIEDFQIYALYRQGRSISYLSGTNLEKNDLVVAAASREGFTALLRKFPNLPTLIFGGNVPGNIQEPESPTDNTGETQKPFLLAEAVITPVAHLLHKSAEEMNSTRETGCHVLGIRRPQAALTRGFRDIELDTGDVLLMLGREGAIRDLRFNHDIFPLEDSCEALPDAWRGRWAAWILFATLLPAATGMLPIVVAALLGASLMLMVGVLSLDETARALDRRIYLLIGSALAMSAALEQTGGADILAAALVDLTAGLPAWVVVSLFFLLIALLTNVLSNNATAVLFTPVAIGMAEQLGMDARIFLHGLIFAANASFLTPIAYQTNLLVMAPGNYRFADFARLGAPLVLILWIGFSLFAPWYYNYPTP